MPRSDRARHLTTGGPVDLFADLHPDATWIGGHLEAAVPWAEEVDLRGRSLVLVPSAMHWWRPACIVDAPWQPTLVYPARGLASPWQASRRVDAALGARRCRPPHPSDPARGARRPALNHRARIRARPQRRRRLSTPHRAAKRRTRVEHPPRPLGALRPHPNSRPAPDAAGRRRNRPELSRRAAESAVDRTVAYRKARKATRVELRTRSGRATSTVAAIRKTSARHQYYQRQRAERTFGEDRRRRHL
jgi:hypothetical protein